MLDKSDGNYPWGPDVPRDWAEERHAAVMQKDYEDEEADARNLVLHTEQLAKEMTTLAYYDESELAGMIQTVNEMALMIAKHADRMKLKAGAS